MIAPFYPGSIPETVARIASSLPDRPALTGPGGTFDYAALNGQANQVARFLLSRGAKAEETIGIAIGRSAAFVVAALGILKSGAAYVPLDPSYPEARRRMIAGDAGLLLTLTDASDPNRPVENAPVETVSLQDAAITSQQTSDPGAPPIDPDQLAYVIYTSGSTGVPKGVEVTHRNLRHLVDWHRNAFQVIRDDRATLLANVGFDAAVWELWPYLCTGAALFLPEPEIVRQPEVLRDFLVQHEITILFAPTLLAESLLRTSWPPDTRLRTLLTGGDTLRIVPPPGLPFAIINNYGPAECTVVTTSGEVPPAASASRIPSIGRPIPGARVFLLEAELLDDSLQEVPAGSQGEICIGGAGIARGYRNQPELTARQFIQREGERIYRSGDLGRWNEDGSLQFLGRKDQQVKIRGYRIECGEIEVALNTLPAVRTSVVIVREQRGGHPGLTAYVVSAAGLELSHEELRHALRAALPESMIPEQFVRLAELPVSDNGKIDRERLPEPTAATIIAAAEPALSPVEAELRTILTNLLHIDAMARDDDFFLLGGHSFIAAQLLARIRDRFRVDLGLRTLFENPTLAGMAEQIEQRLARQAVPVESLHEVETP